MGAGDSSTAVPVIPVNTPSFDFPGEAFFSTELAGHSLSPLMSLHALRKFFKTIAICLSVHSSELILEAQVCQIAKRVPQSPGAQRTKRGCWIPSSLPVGSF